VKLFNDKVKKENELLQKRIKELNRHLTISNN